MAANAAGALGSFGQIGLSPGAELILGADQQISSLSGSGSVALGSNTLTVGNSDNLSSTFSGTIKGSGGSLIKSGHGHADPQRQRQLQRRHDGQRRHAGMTLQTALPDGTSLTIGGGRDVHLRSFARRRAVTGGAVSAGGAAAVPEPGTLALLAGRAGCGHRHRVEEKERV